ncbi:MAG: hypothetical protein JST83_05265, partial [Bacteroidetes bacterium]|nr:hypothetical protein [Bacteroidota bacterium]
MKTLLAVIFSCFIISLCAQTTYTVGPGQQYASIGAAYAAIPGSFSGRYIISLESGYSPLNETFPITFTSKAASSAANTITIQPAVSGIIIASADTTGTFVFSGSRYVTVDGRVNGTGSTPDLTVINSNTNGSAFMILPSSAYNTISYTNVQGIYTAIIFNSQYNSSTSTGNQIEDCNISGLGGAFCTYAINTLGTLNSWTGTQILNNNIFNFTTGGLRANGRFDNSIIRGNSFYVTQANAQLSQWSPILVPASTINFVSTRSPNVQVLGNYIGGNAPHCAGTMSAYMKSGAFITLDASATVRSYVDSNIITHMTLRDTSSTPGATIAISLSGLCQAGSRYGNLIGDTIHDNAIVFDSYSEGFTVFQFIQPAGAENNAVGGINVNSAKSASLSTVSRQGYPLYSVLRNNFFGSTHSSTSIRLYPMLQCTYAYEIDTVVNNTFSGISSGSNTFFGIDSGRVVSGNTFKNITAWASANANHCVINGKMVKDNRLFTARLSGVNTFHLIMSPDYALNNSFDSVTYTSSTNGASFYGITDPSRFTGLDSSRVISGNRFSNFFVSDTSAIGISLTLLNTYTSTMVDSNTISNIYVSNGSATCLLYGCKHSGQIIGNTIQGVNAPSYYGINVDPSATIPAITLTNNTVSDFIGKGGYGINVVSANRRMVTGNTVARLRATSNPLYGFWNSGYNSNSSLCRGNKVYDLRAVVPASTSQSSVLGMYISYGNNSDVISGNAVDNVSATAGTGTTVAVSGLKIYSSASTQLIFGHSATHIWIDSGAATSSVAGMEVNASTNFSAYNNLVQVGVRSDGTIAGGDYTRYGIRTFSRYTATLSYYYNTVYLAGGIASGQKNSYAVWVNGINLNLYNNILINDASTQSGPGKNIVLGLNGISNKQLDFNIYRSHGVNGAIAGLDTLGVNTVTTLPAFKTAILGQNLNAMDTDAMLIRTAGDTALINLGPLGSSPALGNGTTFSVPTTLDYYGLTRSATAPAIGAIERGGYQLPVLDSVGNVLCSGSSDGVIQFTIPNNILWDTLKVMNSHSVVVATLTAVTGTHTISQLLPGTYTLRFTDHAADSYVLTVTIQSSIASPSAPAVSSQTICTGTSATLTAAGGTSYEWYDARTGGSLLSTSAAYTTGVLTSTQIFYVQSIAGGCPSVRSADTVTTVLLSAPAITAASSEICIGQAGTLSVTAAAGQVRWYSQATAGTALSSGPSYTFTAGTIYTFYADVTIGLCTGPRGSITIQVDSLPSQPVSTTVTATVCPGASATLSVLNSGAAYSWYSSSTGTTVVATGPVYTTPALTTAATYYVAAYDGHCYSVRTPQAVTLLLAAAPVITPSPADICPGHSATLTASVSGGTVAWYTGATQSSPVANGTVYVTPVLSSGTAYYASITYTNGCTSLRTYDTVRIHLQATPMITASGSQLNSDQPTGNQWYNVNGIISGATGVSYVCPVTGDYFVVTTNAFGCSDTSAVQHVVVNGVSNIDA